MAAARYVTGSSTLSNYAQIGDCSESEDRCRVIVGPWPPGVSHGPTEALYMCHTKGTDLNVFASLDSIPSGSAWQSLPYRVSVDGSSVEQGVGTFPLVIQTGTHAGRILMAAPAARFGLPISVYQSDDGGTGLWTAAQIALDNETHTLSPVLSSGLHIPGGVWVDSSPTLAIDPNNLNHVVVAFPARTDATTENVDLFIAVSTDGGATFQPTPAGDNTAIHIHDDWLRTPGEVLPSWGSQEWQPAIVIDQAGGVDVLFSRSAASHTATSENAQVEARLARWSSFTALASATAPTYVRDLTLPDGTPSISEGWIGTNGNDYQSLVAPTCGLLYAGWVCKRSGSGPAPAPTWDLFVTRIDRIFCTIAADFDQNGTVNAADVAAFAAALSTSDPSADLNADTHVDAQDAEVFFQSVACGCNP